MRLDTLPSKTPVWLLKRVRGEFTLVLLTAQCRSGRGSCEVLAEDHSAPVRKEPLVQSPQVGKLERGRLFWFGAVACKWVCSTL